MLSWEVLKNDQKRVFGGLEANYNQDSILCPKGGGVAILTRRCLARLGLRALERQLGCERRTHGEYSERQQPAGDLRARSGGLSRRSAH